MSSGKEGRRLKTQKKSNKTDKSEDIVDLITAIVNLVIAALLLAICRSQRYCITFAFPSQA